MFKVLLLREQHLARLVKEDIWADSVGWDKMNFMSRNIFFYIYGTSVLGSLFLLGLYLNIRNTWFLV